MTTGTQLNLSHQHSPLAVAGVVLVAVAALFALFVALLDQGQLLAPVMGDVARSANYIHEFTHDARHLLGAPCH
jgi:Probable cobalt transporter subunit (CbtB)